MILVEFFAEGVGSHELFPAARATRKASTRAGSLPLGVTFLAGDSRKEAGCDGPRD